MLLFFIRKRGISLLKIPFDYYMDLLIFECKSTPDSGQDKIVN